MKRYVQQNGHRTYRRMNDLFSVATYRFNNTLQFEEMYDAHACLEFEKPRGNDIPSVFKDSLFLILLRYKSVLVNKRS